MSGFEVAGVVLGVLPLLVGALKQYTKGVSTIVGTIQYETVFSDLHATLLVANTTLRQSFEEVLQCVDISDAHFRLLVEGQEGWDNEELKRELRWRLKGDVAAFELFLAQIQKKVGKLAKELKLDGPALSPRFVVNGIIDEKLQAKFFRKSNLTWGRIRRGLKADGHKALATNILESTMALNRLVQNSLNLQEERQERSQSTASHYWLSIRSHTCRLHDALQAIWPHTCPIHSHRVTLELQDPSHDRTDSSHAQFRTSFSLQDEQTQHGWGWKEVKVLTNPTHSPLERHHSKPPANSSQKRVRFVDSDQAIQRGRSQKDCPSTNKINDLCSSLATEDRKTQCLGFLAHQEWHFHMHDVRVLPKPRKLVSLREMLKLRTPTLRERCFYALSLASAVLLLYDTPWLRERWSLDEVYVQDGGTPRLYISRTFASPSANAQPTCITTTQYSPARNETVFALGVALLELAHGQEISHFETELDCDRDYPPQHAMTRFRIADRLTKEAQTKQSRRFAFAVARCVCPASDTYDFSLAGERYRRKFYQDVVSSLQEEYEFLFDNKAAP